MTGTKTLRLLAIVIQVGGGKTLWSRAELRAAVGDSVGHPVGHQYAGRTTRRAIATLREAGCSVVQEPFGTRITLPRPPAPTAKGSP